MTLRHVRKAVETRGEIGVLTRLHQPEMAVRQRDGLVARQRSDNGYAQGGDGLGHQRAMPFAADAIQDDPGNSHGGIVRRKASHHGRRRLRLSGDVEDEQHRHLKPRGNVGRCSGAAGPSADAVEQAHDAFDHEQLSSARRFRRQVHRAAAAASPSCRD